MDSAAIAQEISYKSYLLRGITYQTYFAQMQEIVVGINNGTNPEVAHAQYLPINLKRMQRLEKTVKLNNEILDAIQCIDTPINWLVLSEFWCGDAAQSMPLLNKVAEASEGKIKLRILFRDQNTELMANHLTNGGSSIPKLIQLDSNYAIIGEWGPRPQVAQELVKMLKSDPITAPNYAEQLHRWYAQDKTINIQSELTELILNGLPIV